MSFINDSSKIVNLCYDTNYFLLFHSTFILPMESQIDNELAAIGKRLHQLRKHRNLTQLDLEVASGIPNADISRIENGKKNIEVITLIKFSLALKVKLMEIFNYDGKLPK